MNKTKTTSTWISKRLIKPMCNSYYSWLGEHIKTPNSKRRMGRIVVVNIKQRIRNELTRMLPKAKIVGSLKTSTSLWFSSSVKAHSSSRISTTFFLTAPLRILGSSVTKKKTPRPSNPRSSITAKIFPWQRVTLWLLTEKVIAPPTHSLIPAAKKPPKSGPNVLS